MKKYLYKLLSVLHTINNTSSENEISRTCILNNKKTSFDWRSYILYEY